MDHILYYKTVCEKLTDFLDKKPLATRIWIPAGPKLLKRGSKNGIIYAKDVVELTNKKFLDARKEFLHLKDARSLLTKKQESLWNYFVPRKNMDLFYSTNGEGYEKPLDRIFIDIDRHNLPAEKAQIVANELIKIIDSDSNFPINYKKFFMWTGSSFHIYLLLKDKVEHEFYEDYLSYNNKHPLKSFTGKWAALIKSKTKIDVFAGHEKFPNKINLDPSQSVSGKLARAPYSLHMKDALTVDGIAVPLKQDQLQDKHLLKDLKKLNPENIFDSEYFK